MVHEDGQISEAELAAFADGSLSPRRRAQVAACIERSRELRVLVGAQRAALAAVRIAYSIVAGNPLAWPANARRTRRDGTELRHLRTGVSPPPQRLAP